jgi:hypothetical protein
VIVSRSFDCTKQIGRCNRTSKRPSSASKIDIVSVVIENTGSPVELAVKVVQLETISTSGAKSARLTTEWISKNLIRKNLFHGAGHRPRLFVTPPILEAGCSKTLEPEPLAEPSRSPGPLPDLSRAPCRFARLTPAKANAGLIRHMNLEHLHRLRERPVSSEKSVRYAKRIEKNRGAGTFHALKNPHRFLYRESLTLRCEERSAHLFGLNSHRENGNEEDEKEWNHARAVLNSRASRLLRAESSGCRDGKISSQSASPRQS